MLQIQLKHCNIRIESLDRKCDELIHSAAVAEATIRDRDQRIFALEVTFPVGLYLVTDSRLRYKL